MDILEGGSSFCLAFVSLMTIFSFSCGLGLPTLIRVLLLALKYMECSFFHFSFYLVDVLRVASTGAASLAKISAIFSLCCPLPKLPCMPIPNNAKPLNSFDETSSRVIPLMHHLIKQLIHLQVVEKHSFQANFPWRPSLADDFVPLVP